MCGWHIPSLAPRKETLNDYLHLNDIHTYKIYAWNWTRRNIILEPGITQSDWRRNVIVFGCLGEKKDEWLTRLYDSCTGYTCTNICVYIRSANFIQHRSRQFSYLGHRARLSVMLASLKKKWNALNKPSERKEYSNHQQGYACHK
jgi:hypothetical protein